MPSLKLPIYGQAGGLDAPRWKSLAEREGRERPAPGEFPEGAAETPEGFSRRGFLQLLGASAALAGLSGCRPPREKLVPYVRRPSLVPSVPVPYATAASDGGHAFGLVVTSWEGRPTKVEGNRDHPASLGGTDAFRQAFILDLYDPDRLDGFRRGGRALGHVTLLAELAALAKEHEKDGGARLRFLVEPTSSPAVGALRARILARFPQARFVAWSPLAEDAALEGARLAFGRPLAAGLELGEADVILSLDADFLAREGDHVRHARAFAARREDGARLNRLYQAEAAYTVTGGMADHRLRMRSAEVLPFARAVAAELASGHGLSALAPLGAPARGEHARAARAVAKDLARARGRSLVVAGVRQPAALHALAAALNDALGNAGRTVVYRPPVLLDEAAGPAGLAALAAELAAGKVDALVVTAWNPLHTAPGDVDLRGAFRKAKDSIVLALRDDETVRAASWKLAASHPLESWGDLRARDGSVSVVQPLVAPLKESLTELELLAALVDDARSPYQLVRDGWRERSHTPAPLPSGGSAAAANPPDANKAVPPDPFGRRWEEWLAAGVAAGTAAAPEAAAPDLARVAQALSAAPAPQAGGVEVNFVPDYTVLDGRYLENAWLQELPDPITKLTWDNAALLSPATARRLGVADGDVVTIARGGRQVSAPALAVPGHADETVTLPLGYGQAAAGAVGARAGFDAYPLRTRDAQWFAGGAELARGEGRARLAVTQGHFSMEGRTIALALDAGALDGAQERLEHIRGDAPTILEPVDYSQQDYKWGMAIDLSKCIGCGTCTAACQAENNIPVVGRDEVLRSREMHWIRVDRYYEGTPDEPTSVSQPLGCVHCEMAPCEYVCPVNATVHSDEGLNEMVYNRCVGTRYCSNNCPYKVRRFNYLDYRGEVAGPLQLLMNPDVTVRARGVMEKCTYCTQRIQRARIDARSAGRKVGPDEVVPACAQACPADAIVFGNLNDPASKVSRKHADARRYDLLHDLGTRPRTVYLVKLRNPNPDLA